MRVPKGHTASKRSRQDLNRAWAHSHFAQRLCEDRRSTRQGEAGREDRHLPSPEAVLSITVPPTELISSNLTANKVWDTVTAS